jgi:hypothetical protein
LFLEQPLDASGHEVATLSLQARCQVDGRGSHVADGHKALLAMKSYI